MLYTNFISAEKRNENGYAGDNLMEKFLIIDGNSLANRAFYALPALSNGQGIPTQAVYGFAGMLIKAIEEVSPDYIAVAFDLPEPTFRHKRYDLYKATRKKMPDELAVQFPLLKEMLGKMNIAVIEKAGFEADDIIGTMVKHSGMKSFIITGDRDSFQLIDDNVSVMFTKRGITEIQKLDPEALMQDMGFVPSQIIDYKALCGDSSDNIPGVPGVGEKTAVTLLETYGTLDNVYAHIDEISGKLKDKLVSGKESAYMSYELATINTNVPLDISAKDCSYPYPFGNAVKSFFIDMKFKTLIKRADIFTPEASGVVPEEERRKPPCETVSVGSVEELEKILSGDIKKFAFHIGETINFAFDAASEKSISIVYSLIDDGLDYVAVLNAFKPLMENPEIQKVVFDAKALMKTLELSDISLKGFVDVKLMQYLVDMKVNYENINKFLEAYEISEREPATGLMYICNTLSAEIEKLGMHKLYYDVELPLADVLRKMEKRGFRIDAKILTDFGEEFTQKQEEFAELIFADAGERFNINSPKQLAKVLFENMGITYPKKSKTYSTSAEILELLEAKHPIARKVLRFRYYAKLNSTYVDGLRKLADRNGIVHTEFRQALTSTGRLSSVEPNLQNIPVRQEEGRKLRAAFVASEGNILTSADYSQIELRLMAHFSGDEKMVDAYKKGEDIHTSTAAEVFGVDKKDVTRDMRREAKAVNFGIIYGISDFGLGENLGISSHKAREYIAKYFEKFSGVKAYLDKAVKIAKENGYATTLLGRMRKIPELISSNYVTRQFGERVAMNMPLQGSAADIIKIAMINVEKALENMKSKLILQIHDELIVDTAPDEAEEVKKILKENMENAVELSVPLTVEVGQGKSWFDCK